jgi:hypothetical protein
MKPFFTLSFLFLFICGKSQVTIALQDFEASPASPTMTFITSDVSTVGAASGICAGQSGAAASNAPSGVNLFASGTQGYRVQGSSSGLISRALTFDNVNTSSYNNIKLSFRIAGMSLGSNANGIDGTTNAGGVLPGTASMDVAVVEISPDGGTTWYLQGAVNVTAANANVRWSFGAAGSGTKTYAPDNAYATFTTTGTGTITAGSGAITKAEITNLPSVPNLKVRITLQLLGSANESWIIDDVLLTGNFVSTNSNFSDIIYNTAFAAPGNIDYKNYQATDITSTNSVEVAQFTIQDGGGTADADALGTIINTLSFLLSNSSNINKVALYDGGTEIAETTAGAIVNFVGITGLSAPDDGSKTFSLRVTYNNTVTDNQQYQFTVNSVAVNASGSGFAAANAGGASSSIVLDNNRIEVIADRLAFVQNTTSPTNPNVAMTPAPTISANDINNNRDVDYTASIDITSSGTLQTSPLSAPAVNGAVGFNNIIHTATGTNFTLTATSGTLINTTSTAFDIAIATSATDYFRSKQNGNWNTASTWESSINGTSWISATLVPDFNANIIEIAHTVTINTPVNANQMIIKNNGTLINALSTGTFTLNSTSSNFGYTLDIENGGVYQVINTQNFTSHITFQSGASIFVRTGGIIRMGNGGAVGGNANGYLTSFNINWQTGAIFDWNSTNTPGATNVIYFPDAPTTNSNPILRFSTSPSSNMGGNTPLTVNGTLEANVPITYDQIGDKIFRGGIINNAPVTFTLGATGKVVIGSIPSWCIASAQLGGTGIINVTGGEMIIGGACQFSVLLLNNKIINGTVNLANFAIIDLQSFTLTVNAVTGGFADQSTGTYRFFNTESGGALKINNVGTTPVVYPVGAYSSPIIYSPVTITNTGTADNFSVSYNRALPSCLSSLATNSVIGSWIINEDVTGGSNTTLSIDYSTSTTGSGFMASAAKIAHCNGSAIDYTNGSVTGTVATGSGFTGFSPFGISSDILLPVKLESFTASQANTKTNLNWRVSGSSNILNYEIEKSSDGISFTKIGTVASQQNNNYSFVDNDYKAGTFYYRLKINETNGSFYLSPIQKIKINGKGLSINNIYPTPAKDNITFEINSSSGGLTVIEIVDFNGKIVLQNSFKATTGNNVKLLNTSKLQAGMYLIRVKNDTDMITEKIIKQ